MLTVFLYPITPGRCPDCGIETLPHSGAIRGTSLGPKAGAAMYSHKAGKNSVIDAKRSFKDIHRREFSNGAISNCTGAIAADIKGEVMEIRSKSVVLEGGDGRPFRSPVRPPPRAAGEQVRRVRFVVGALRNRLDNVPSVARHGADTGEIYHGSVVPDR